MTNIKKKNECKFSRIKDMNPFEKAHQDLNKVNKSKSTCRYNRKKTENTRHKRSSYGAAVKDPALFL